MRYNSKFLDYQPIFSDKETKELEDISSHFPLEKFLSNKNLVEKFGFDFIYTSAKIEGNTYTKAEALTLLDYGNTSSKSYSDAKMLINLKNSYRYMLEDDCIISKQKIRSMHQILAADLVELDELGNVRKKGVLIKGSDYIPLSSYIELESELDRVVQIYHSIESSFDKALYIHNNLAYLQYFADVNKRTARNMLNLSLMCEKKMMLIPQEELISLYVEGILEYYEQGSYNKQKEFFIKSYRAVLENVKEVGDIVINT